jgi:uncharacterized cupredoxin-like copper-binding protein
MAAHIIRGRMRTALTAGLAATCALAGCGGDDESAREQAAKVPAGHTVEVTATEYRFEPSAVEVAGGAQTVRFKLDNAGAVAHDLRVRRGADDLGGTPIFAPGRSAGARMKLTPGSYEIFCSVPGHEEQGMRGTLIVR